MIKIFYEIISNFIRVVGEEKRQKQLDAMTPEQRKQWWKDFAARNRAEREEREARRRK